MPNHDRPAAPVVPSLRDRLAVGSRVCKRLGYGPHQLGATIIALALLAAAKAGVDVLDRTTEDELVSAGREAEKAIKATLGQPVDPAAVVTALVEVAGLRMAAAHEAQAEARWRSREEELARTEGEAIAARERARLEAAAAEEAERERARAEREAAEQLAAQQAEAERARLEAAAQDQGGGDPLDELGEDPAAKPPTPRKR